jgi:hypothetical protein
MLETEWQLSSQRDRRPGGDGTSPPPLPCPVPLLLEYYDSFLRRPMRILLSQSSEIFRPLHLVEAAAVRLYLPRGYPIQHEKPRSPSKHAYMRVSV